MEVIRSAGGENELRRERGSESPKAADPRPQNLEIKAPGCLSLGRVPTPFLYMKVYFYSLLLVPLGLTLIVLVSCVMELRWGRQRSVDDGITEGLWQRPLRRKEEEREMGFGSAKLSLNKKRVFVLFASPPPPHSSSLAKQI